METTLARIEQAVQLLAGARDFGDVHHIYAMASAAEEYARVEGLGREAEDYAREIRVRAARKAGEILRGMAKNPGGRPSTKTSMSGDEVSIARVTDLGITHPQSARWQRIAAVPEEVFEQKVAAGRGEAAISQASPPLREMPVAVVNEKGSRVATIKQSLHGLEQVSIQIEGIGEAMDGGLVGDWTRLFEIPEAQDMFDRLERGLTLVNARAKRILRERRQHVGLASNQ